MQSYFNISKLTLLVALIVSLFPDCEQSLNPAGAPGRGNQLTGRGAKSERRFRVGPILFVSFRVDSLGFLRGSKQLYSMDQDGGNVQQVTFDTNFTVEDASFSSGSDSIALETFTLHDSSNNIISVLRFRYPSISVLRVEAGTREFVGTVFGYHPIWIGNNSRILFMPVTNGYWSEFGLTRPDGSDYQSIQADAEIVRVGGWSDIRQQILAEFVMPTVDSSGTHRNTENIAFFDLQGRAQTRIGTWGEDLRYPALSRSGNRIACWRTNSTDSSGLYLFDLTNGLARMLLAAAADGPLYQPVSFSPDDTKLLLNARVAPKANDILLYDLTTAGMKTLTPFPKRAAASYAVDWRK